LSFVKNLSIALNVIDQKLEKMNNETKDHRRAIDQKLEKMNNETKDHRRAIDQKLEHHGRAIDQKLEHHGRAIENLNQSIQQEFTTIRKKIKKVKTDLIRYSDEKEARANGTIAIYWAQRTAVRVEIYPPSKERNNSFASGNYVSIQGKCYVSTCRHVVVESVSASMKNIFREIRSLEMIDGFHLTPLNHTVFSTTSDVALIEVECEQNRQPAEIALVEPVLGERLYGLSYRPKGIVSMPSTILEIHPPCQGVMRFETDGPGTHGFSGSGLFNQVGRLIAIHSAGKPFGHIGNEDVLNPKILQEKSMGSSIERSWSLTESACLNAWKNLEHYYNMSALQSCLRNLRIYVQEIARNPRSQVEAAVTLIELAEKGDNWTFPTEVVWSTCPEEGKEIQ
jgi:hypothetical protein